MPKEPEHHPILARRPAEPASAREGDGAPQVAVMTVEGDVATNQFVIVDHVPASQAVTAFVGGRHEAFAVAAFDLRSQSFGSLDRNTSGRNQ